MRNNTSPDALTSAADTRKAEEQEAALRNVRARIAVGLEQARCGELINGETVFARLLGQLDGGADCGNERQVHD
jgi:hypothetical protein